MTKTEYGGWQNCVTLSNGTVELVITTDVGPRIMRYGFVGKPNVLKEYTEQLGLTGGDEWRIYGGHRLWHAPEEKPRSYFPDNTAINYRWDGNWLELDQPVETTTGIKKDIEIKLSENGTSVQLIHSLTNFGFWAVELAPWALTVMAPGGIEIIPREPYRPHTEVLLPESPMVQWAYTQLADPRWVWGNKYIQLKQDPNITSPQKIGLLNKQGWVAYWNDGYLFVKRFPNIEGAIYPDMGCNFETFTNNEMLEVESLGTMEIIEPGETINHTEQWYLFQDVPKFETEEDIDAIIMPLIAQAETELFD